MSLHHPRGCSLKLFDPSGTGSVRSLAVRLHQSVPEIFSLRYVLDADLRRLRVPATRTPERRDELWRHTCFELFVRKGGDGTGYYELNVSPSTEWALYAFEGYHENRVAVDPVQPPQARVTRDDNMLQLEVELDLRGLPHSDEVAPAAVIEEEGDGLSYWALKHLSARPDFHHPDSFSSVDSWRRED
ncbi:DOMON-like domain-containing protein [Streptomyces sp. NBC_01435]|uniref:DOMON-like domain-containing protein n=1 Tax=Streptomyces sp. NBC_01435 TaxID=2903865 RepID=UPI002E2EA45B|nr:DOMON-like domain-containing protein [Streptomyces sp. NBC_01435]